MAQGIKANLSKELLEELLKDHTLKEVAEKLNVSISTVKRYKNKYNLKVNLDIAKDRNSQKHKKYNYKMDYFQKIDTFDKAYLLGFLCADGFVTDRNEIGIGVASKDKAIVEFFKQQLQTDKPITIKEGLHPSVELRVQDRQLAKDIQKYGIIPNKSLILNIAEVIQKANLSESYISVFLLGYFDGDGCISLAHRQDNQKEYFEMNVTGTFETISYFKEYFDGHGTITKRDQTSNNNNYTLSFSNNYSTIYNALSKIYKYREKLTFYLERKYKLFAYLTTKVKS